MRDVLVTCAGRRVSLVRSFIAAARAEGARVLAADSSPLAPALLHADLALRLPLLDDPDYLPALLALVREQEVGLVVPTIDTELALLAAHRDEIAAAGAVALISDPAFVDLCGDKATTVRELARHGLDVPASWLPDQLDGADLPAELIVKPRDGSASRDVHVATPDGVAEIAAMVPLAIVQERLTGPEITIDALIDLEGRPIHFVPRRRIKTLGGESIQGVTLDDDVLRAWTPAALEVLAGLGARGPVTIQLFLTPRGPVVIEVNPRFGGGFPLTAAAGGDYPAWILAMLAGRAPAPRLGEYTTGLYMTRHLVEDFVTSPLW